MAFSVFFFDLDDTLYPSTCGLWGEIRDRMTKYMVERLDIPPEEVSELRQLYFEKYGTTLRGLQTHFRVDPHDFLAYVHDLPLKSYLRPDPELRELIDRIKLRKWIFTNADHNHARRVLSELGLGSCFEGIIDVCRLDFVCKPNPGAYRRAMEIVGEIEPARCLFVDDSPRNLVPARELGFYTILIGSSEPEPAAQMSIPSIHCLPQTFPDLFTPLSKS
jgi:putative hydrolase of the HAD superfamily